MVIPEDRSRVHQALSDLVSGQITNMEFDPVYEEFHSSPDRAAAEIAHFGWCLYSDSVTYRITEHYRISPEVRETASKCLLFLQTDLEFAWPEWPKKSLVFTWLSIGISFWIASLALLAWAFGDAIFVRFFACGLMFSLLVHQSWVLFIPRRQDSPAWKVFWGSGDKDAWPFLWSSEHQEALQTVSQSGAGPGK